MSSTVNSGVSVGKVPADAGAGCLRASEPAIASTGTIRRNRPTSIARPSVVLYQSVFPVSPPNAEPLLFAADVNAYTTSESPCGPGIEDRRLRAVREHRRRRERRGSATGTARM